MIYISSGLDVLDVEPDFSAALYAVFDELLLVTLAPLGLQFLMLLKPLFDLFRCRLYLRRKLIS